MTTTTILPCQIGLASRPPTWGCRRAMQQRPGGSLGPPPRPPRTTRSRTPAPLPRAAVTECGPRALVPRTRHRRPTSRRGPRSVPPPGSSAPRPSPIMATQRVHPHRRLSTPPTHTQLQPCRGCPSPRPRRPPVTGTAWSPLPVPPRATMRTPQARPPPLIPPAPPQARPLIHPPRHPLHPMAAPPPPPPPPLTRPPCRPRPAAASPLPAAAQPTAGPGRIRE